MKSASLLHPNLAKPIHHLLYLQIHPILSSMAFSVYTIASDTRETAITLTRDGKGLEVVVC